MNTTLEIVRAPAWQALVRRLDGAVTRDPRLAEARDAVLRPVELLQVMADDAHGALGDDVLRADRLRAMLFVAWPYVQVAVEARRLLAAKSPPKSDDTTLLAAVSVPEWPEPQAYEPGVIDHAGLLVLALAAARVADPPFAPVFVASIEGLALAASAAEVLGRLDPRQPDAAALEVVLHTLYMIEAARAVTRNELLRPFAFDPVERGRWRCLDELMTGPAITAAVQLARDWDGATSDEIVAVIPKYAMSGDKITVRVRGGNPLPGATVVFASANAPLCPASAKLGKAGPDLTTIEVTVPAGAAPGWIGFSRSDRIATSNKARLVLRGQLATQLDEPCVDGAGRIDPALSIPDYGALATPRRRGRDRFEGGAPTVVHVSVTPERVRPGDPVKVRWEAAGATAVRLSVGGVVVAAAAPASGTRELFAPASDGEIQVEVAPSVVRGGRTSVGAPAVAVFVVDAPVRIASLALTQAGRAQPLFAQRALEVGVQLDTPVTVARAWLIVGDARLEPGTIESGRITFTIPPALVRDGMTLTAGIEDRNGTAERRSAGPLVMHTPRTAEVVVVRPAIVAGQAVIEPIELEHALKLVDAAAAFANVTASVVELPWADDELAVLAERPDGDSDPVLLRVLEQLSRRALITPRFEHAIWLALLPDPTHAGSELRAAMLAAADPVASIARALPANAARAVAVATPAGLSRLFAGLFPAERAPEQPIAVGPRLAILGTLNGHDLVIDELRVDERGEGPGAPVTTTLAAVVLDANGEELAHVPVRVLTANRPATLAVLVPVSAAVASIELRDDDRLVRKVIRRISGQLTASVTRAPDAHHPDTFEWTWDHTRHARPTASLLLRRGGMATPVLDVDPCGTSVELPLSRFAGADAFALYTTDGWSAVESAVTSHAFENPSPVVLRRLRDGRFFADAPRAWSVTWLLDGAPRGKKDERTLALAPGDDGVLELVARSGGQTVRDRIRIGR